MADKTALELLCKSIREEDETLKVAGDRKHRKAGIDWKVGHCFRHKLFGYLAVVRGWDETCLASEDCKLDLRRFRCAGKAADILFVLSGIQAMQVDTLPYGRNQPFYHVVRTTLADLLTQIDFDVLLHLRSSKMVPPAT